MALLKVLGTITFTIVLTLLSIFVYSKVAGPIPFSITSTVTQKNEAFSVTGEGKASIKPDNATVNVGVTASGTTAEEAKNKLNQSINKVISAVKTLGVNDKDIKTDSFNILPQYDDRLVVKNNLENVTVPSPTKDPDGSATSYRAVTTLTISLNQIDLANQVIDAAVRAGANQLSGAQFSTEDKTAAETEARQKAIDAAKAKAQTAAQAAGFKLGKIINYSESTGGFGPMMYAAKAGDSAVSNQNTQLQPGENEVSMSVTLSYEVL